MQSGFPSLIPLYGLSTNGRTSTAILISGPRTRIGSQKRIYTFYKGRGEGQLYEQYLINSLGLKYLPKVNPWSLI